MAIANPGLSPDLPLRRNSARLQNAAITIFSVSAILLVAWLGWQENLFSSNFLPRVYCYLRNPRLVALHLVSDVLIWTAYVAISITLVYLERRLRREMGNPPFQWVYLAFGAFIVACGWKDDLLRQLQLTVQPGQEME